MGLQCRQSAAPVFQLHLSLLSCIWGVKRSRGQQRLPFKSNTGYLAFVEDWTKACVRGFSTTCPALSSALYYRLIPCAVDFCPLCHIKGKGLRMGKCRSCGGKLSFVTRTEILAHFVEAVIKLCVIRFTLS